ERKRAAEVAEEAEPRRRTLDVEDRRRLRDLEAEGAARDHVDRILDQLQYTLVVQARRGEIDEHASMRSTRQTGEHELEHPPVEFCHEPETLGGRDEAVRQDE